MNMSGSFDTETLNDRSINMHKLKLAKEICKRGMCFFYLKKKYVHKVLLNIVLNVFIITSKE